MPTKRHGTTWPAAPHTVAKIHILQSYLYAYFQILGRTSPGSPILYLDGFAGPGEYENLADGSPVAAIKAAITARRDAIQQGAWKAGGIKMAFIEANRDRCENLRRVVQEVLATLHVSADEVECQMIRGEFAQHLADVKTWCPSPFTTNAPLFAFVDPFGPTGVPFDLVRDLLSSPCSELLFNLDADGIARIFKAQEAAGHETILDGVFGVGQSDWRDVLDSKKPMSELCADVLALYKRRLRALPGVRYVFSFGMMDSDSSLNYFLVFASKHPRGLEKMKEAMKQLDQDGSYTFRDTNATTGQVKLIRFDHPEDFARTFFEAFKSQNASFAAMNDWALNESPFTNSGKMLAYLESNGHVRVHVKAGEKRRKGTFVEEKIRFVEFASSWNELFKPEK